MPYLRFTRDRRGYEHTYLLHVTTPGAPPAVLYYYRTAPGVRLGRPALDEDAIRLIEEQHPDLDFDWTHLLEMGALAAMEPDEPQEPVRRKRPRRSEGERRPRAARPAEARGPESRVAAASEVGEAPPVDEAEVHEVETPDAAPSAPPVSALLEQLVGGGIASRLRGRFKDLAAEVHALPADVPARDALTAQLRALDPDDWTTAEQILDGVQHADARAEALRRALAGR